MKNRERTNFQSCQLIKDRWIEDTSITFGIINAKQRAFIETTLELSLRDKLSIQDARDFAVSYFATVTDRRDEQYVKLWDCMSAVTSVIDGVLMNYDKRFECYMMTEYVPKKKSRFKNLSACYEKWCDADGNVNFSKFTWIDKNDGEGHFLIDMPHSLIYSLIKNFGFRENTEEARIEDEEENE